MNKAEYLLTCMSEECAETALACSKYLRFGRDSYHPADPSMITNENHLIDETGNILGVMELLIEEGIIHGGPFEAAIDAKKMKVREFMERSRQLGQLQ